MKKSSATQWFVRLFKREIDEYTENQQQKEKIFRRIKKGLGKGKRKWTIGKL